MKRRRVVVTGIGSLSSMGLNVSQMWSNLKDGKCGINTITRIDVSEQIVKIAAEVKGFDPRDYMSEKESRKMARFSMFACAAASMAIDMARLKPGSFDKSRSGTVVGVGIGGLDEIEISVRNMVAKGVRSVSPLLIPRIISNEASGNIAMLFGLQGPCLCITTACSSGTDAIITAANIIRANGANIMICGGAEAAISHICISGFTKLTALTTMFNDNPTKASRPFDKDRSGFVIGEGAGILVLEEYEHAKKRGAEVLCEYAGGAMTCDAYHLTSPTPDGSGAVRAFIECLKDAHLQPEDVDYINAHGTSTLVNDPTETLAIKKAFKDHAKKLKISSSKSMMGHGLGAAGGLEAIVSIMAMRNSFVPPTINLDNPDPECDLDYTPHIGKKADLDVVMSDSLGFGGHNGVICFKKY